MAKRTVVPPEEPQETGLTPEEEAEIEREEKEKREAALAKYRAVARQNREQDELIAELLYEITIMEIGA